MPHPFLTPMPTYLLKKSLVQSHDPAPLSQPVAAAKKRRELGYGSLWVKSLLPATVERAFSSPLWSLLADIGDHVTGPD